jgi:hypothetical protein
LSGGISGDRLRGGSGADRLKGRPGDDRLNGGAGIDRLMAGTGVDECIGERLDGCEITEISPGDRGDAVEYLQQQLADALLYRGPVDGHYPDDEWDHPGDMTAAVYAFHKLYRDPQGDAWTRDDRVGRQWTMEDWDRLRRFTPESPVDREGEPNRIEVDARREVMWLILDGEVAGIFHVSIGGEYWFYEGGQRKIAHTPRGDFDIDGYSYGRKENGFQYKSWWFEQSYYAVHGFWKVPPYPASHGCVRVTYDEADWLTARLQVGWLVHVWDS